MPTFVIRKVPDAVALAIRSSAIANQRSTEAELRAILQAAAQSQGSIGDEIAGLGATVGSVNDAVAPSPGSIGDEIVRLRAKVGGVNLEFQRGT